MTPQQLSICTGARIDRARDALEVLDYAMQAYAINTPVRQAMFLANVGHESGALRYRTEVWGPTEAQRRYEGRKDLGNTQPGDGFRYRGRAWWQITGRYNYARVRDRLRVRFPDLGVPDFEADPDRLADPQWAALAAGDYCEANGLNVVADAGDFDGYCDKINRGRKTAAIGDSNGWAERKHLYDAALEVLS